MFKKKAKTTVPLAPLVARTGVVGVPHMTWEADYGQREVPQLALDTGTLFDTIRDLQSEPLLSPERLTAYKDRVMLFLAEEQAYLDSGGLNLHMRLGLIVQIMFETFERSRMMIGAFSPSSVERLTAVPAYLLGKEEAFGWPALYGHLACIGERQLGWQPAGQIDRRTWAALMGWCYAYTLQTAHLPPFEFEQDDDEARARRITAGKFLAAWEQSAIWGYLDARGS